MDDPSTALTAPQAHSLVPEPVDVLLHIGDLVSLGHWALVAIDKMGGPNLPGEIGSWFAGDWEAVSRSADALRKLGSFCHLAAAGVEGDMRALQKDWEGHAAGAASSYFFGLAQDLSEMQVHLDDIAQQFESTAFGVKELASSVGNLVESLVDYAIMAGVELAAAAATSWTVVGGVLGSAGAAYSIIRGALVVREILEIRATVWTACEAVLGLIAGSLSAIRGFSTVALPAAYDNPLVHP